MKNPQGVSLGVYVVPVNNDLRHHWNGAGAYPLRPRADNSSYSAEWSKPKFDNGPLFCNTVCNSMILPSAIWRATPMSQR